jgi:hypothetical protein
MSYGFQFVSQATCGFKKTVIIEQRLTARDNSPSKLVTFFARNRDLPPDAPKTGAALRSLLHHCGSVSDPQPLWGTLFVMIYWARDCEPTRFTRL